MRTDWASSRLAGTLLLIGAGVVGLLAILAFDGGDPLWGAGFIAGAIGLLVLAYVAEERTVQREVTAQKEVEREGST